MGARTDSRQRSTGSAAPRLTALPGRPVAVRFVLLLCAAVALILGICAGLARLGWDIAGPVADLGYLHGPLMVSGFFGTLIGLERAVALRHPAAYAGPVAAGAGTVLLVSGIAPAAGQLGWIAGSAGLVVASAVVAKRQPAPFTIALLFAAASWCAGNLLWFAGFAVPAVVLWWMIFLVLTIAGERLEMSRLLRPRPAMLPLFFMAAALLGIAAALAVRNLDRALPLAGIALIILAGWLVRHDIAQRTVRQSGLPRFSAICLLSGYAWLALAGVLALGMPPAFGYDAVLHAVFIGFVFSMVFGHAPIILPAVARINVPFRPVFYAPLALLHGSLAVRVAGDICESFALRRWSGIVTVAALLLFAGTVAASRLQAPDGRGR